MPPKKRGFKFTTHELESLADAVADIIPMSNTDWDTVWEAHNESFPGLNRTSDSLKRKFQEMARTKIPTGDPNCPHHIHIAKRAYYRFCFKFLAEASHSLSREFGWRPDCLCVKIAGQTVCAQQG